MPFGLRNAPQIFQRKMDKIFKQYVDFIITYINDILAFQYNFKRTYPTSYDIC